MSKLVIDCPRMRMCDQYVTNSDTMRCLGSNSLLSLQTVLHWGVYSLRIVQQIMVSCHSADAVTSINWQKLETAHPVVCSTPKSSRTYQFGFKSVPDVPICPSLVLRYCKVYSLCTCSLTSFETQTGIMWKFYVVTDGIRHLHNIFTSFKTFKHQLYVISDVHGSLEYFGGSIGTCSFAILACVPCWQSVRAERRFKISRTVYSPPFFLFGWSNS